MADVPLIHTTKGNLPVASLEHYTEWRDSTEQVIFVEGYLLDGEIVKQSTHVLIRQGVSILGEASL